MSHSLPPPNFIRSNSQLTLILTMALFIEKTTSGCEYKVKDMSQADFGRLEIELAEVEMPGLMSCRTEFGPSQPFKGARITDSHLTIGLHVLYGPNVNANFHANRM